MLLIWINITLFNIKNLNINWVYVIDISQTAIAKYLSIFFFDSLYK